MSTPEQLALWAGAACYAIAAASLLLPRAPRRDGVVAGPLPAGLLPAALLPAALLLGALLLAVAIAARWSQFGQGPFLTLYEILLSNAFSLGLLYAALYRLYPPARPGAPGAIAVLLLLTGWALAADKASVPLPPTFDNPWLWAHVLLGKLFLGCALAAFGLAVHRLCGGRQPAAAMWQLLALAFVFDSLMITTGAAWAQDAWGRFWGWDPVEVWALLTWLSAAIALHVRSTLSLPGWAGAGMVALVFGLAFLTFFGVPLLNQVPHQGVVLPG